MIAIPIVLVYMAIMAGCMALYRAYFFETTEYEIESKEVVVAIFWPVTLPFLGVCKLSELIEKELKGDK